VGDYRTKQEEFWARSFGSEYIGRNSDGEMVSRLLPFWSDIMRRAGGVSSVLELGSNIGLNLRALKMLSPAIELSAVEINETSAGILREWGGCEVFQKSILDFEPSRTWELVFTRGVLIHINPDELPGVYDMMTKVSSRCILIAEYYNPVPVEVPYRGNDGFLFKRDFAGEIMDRTDSLRLVDYGFVYHRDPIFPQDDITWFLLERVK
jgi:spore coat polysaccharide biosynthesis protein SpsF